LSAAPVHLWRLFRWGRTLARHGALRPLERDPRTPAWVRRVAWFASFAALAPRQPRFAEAFRALGPAAIKLGQALSTRPDLVGEDAAHDLRRLQDQLPPTPFADVREMLERAFDKPFRELFQSIDPTPIGAASIAQVYRAVTSDGRTVAVKVLRPGIEDQLRRAISTYEWAAERVEREGGEAARLRPRATIAAFRRWTERELDLRLEAAAASELAEDSGDPALIVPRVDWARTGKRVLTLEWIEGIKLSDPKAVAAADLDGRKLACVVFRAFLHQAIARGFFHADLHQGNLFALPGDRVAVIDFGIMGRLDRRARIDLARILYGLLTADYETVARVHFDAGFVPKHHSVEDFATALRAVGEPIRGLPVKDISVARLLDGLFAITRLFDMPTQPHLLLLQKTMVMVEGVAAALDPEINTWEIAEPYVRDWMRSELGPEARVADAITRNLSLLADVPAILRRLIALIPPELAAPPEPEFENSRPAVAEPGPLEIRAAVRVPWWTIGAVGLGGLAAGLGIAAAFL
jgi:ubiquinone biosynthesis protein